MEHESGIEHVLDQVRETARSIRELEAAAMDALHNKGDKDTHRFNMMEKCELLAEMPEHAEPYLKGDDPVSERLRAGLKDFARRANMALDLESIFFMQALLYPDDYQDGEPNDLERFIMKFEKA
ncbi:hypothetical protein [Fundidesulfovibrio terrae]|uniref:hypothetical protein n=1 Tax=Fundidesulfovibrio terrae TaxID=2922866 RepID=UPI001FAF8EC1|nr:hypothetical protein [Fundidesulfovibrio terrae]